MMLIAIVLFVVAGVLAAGVFLYKNLTDADATSKKEQLEKAREAFDPSLIAELTATSDRIRIAEGILEEHTAPSLFLASLEQDTLAGVQFSELEYKQKSASVAEIKLKGKAASMNTVALQSSRFGESALLKNPIFSGVDLVTGGVVFEVTGEVDLNAVRYASVAAMRGAATNAALPSTTNNMGSATLSVPQGGGSAGNGGFGLPDAGVGQ